MYSSLVLPVVVPPTRPLRVTSSVSQWPRFPIQISARLLTKFCSTFSLRFKVPFPYPLYGQSTTYTSVLLTCISTMGHTHSLCRLPSEFISIYTEGHTHTFVEFEHRRYARGAVLRPHGPGSIVLSFFSRLLFVARAITVHYLLKNEAIHNSISSNYQKKTDCIHYYFCCDGCFLSGTSSPEYRHFVCSPNPPVPSSHAPPCGAS